MNLEQLQGIVRHVLTFGGGLLVTYGYITDLMYSELIGGSTALAGLIWSIISKNKTKNESV
jgi:hypothetical protein